MAVFFKNDGGYVARGRNKGELEICLNHVKLTLKRRTLKQLWYYLKNMDPKHAIFTPEEKCMEVSFLRGKICLLLNYFEWIDFCELIEEGLCTLSLDNMLEQAGVGRPDELIS